MYLSKRNHDQLDKSFYRIMSVLKNIFSKEEFPEWLAIESSHVNSDISEAFEDSVMLEK